MTKIENKNTKVSTTTTKSFWIIAGLILIWNLMGTFHLIDYLTTSVEKMVSQGMTIEQAEFFLRGPAYIGIIFGLGVCSGLLGSIFLLSRKTWAIQAFIFSAAMTILSFIIDGIDGGFSILGPVYLAIISFTIMVAVFEAWYSNRAKANGILK